MGAECFVAGVLWVFLLWMLWKWQFCVNFWIFDPFFHPLAPHFSLVRKRSLKMLFSALIDSPPMHFFITSKNAQFLCPWKVWTTSFFARWRKEVCNQNKSLCIFFMSAYSTLLSVCIPNQPAFWLQPLRQKNTHTHMSSCLDPYQPMVKHPAVSPVPAAQTIQDMMPSLVFLGSTQTLLRRISDITGFSVKGTWKSKRDTSNKKQNMSFLFCQQNSHNELNAKAQSQNSCLHLALPNSQHLELLQLLQLAKEKQRTIVATFMKS